MEREIKLGMYDSFHCIADKCSITCCQEWKIEVDQVAYDKWNSMHLIEEKENSLNHYVTKKSDYNIIRLNEENKCPFLNEHKLCRLVEQFGDEALSDTCTTFPREIHEFENHTEYSLVSCCPEVIDLLEKQEKIEFVKSNDVKCQDSLFQIRELLIELIQNKSLSIPKALMTGFFLLTELLEMEEISEDNLKQYRDKSVLEQLSREIDNMEFSSFNSFCERNELFLDLAQNYRYERLYTGYLEKIGLLAEKLENDYQKEEIKKELRDFQSQLEKYEHLFRNYLVSELFTNSLIPNSDFYDMMIMFQWIAMEYVMIKHAIFLEWKSKGKHDLTYTEIRDYMVIISRMTGYDQEDVEEYLENCFENPIWEWGYFALLSGNSKI